MKLKPLQSSMSSIRMGLDMVGKAYLTGREWTGKFAQQQYLHQYPKQEQKKTKFGKFVAENMGRLKLNKTVCGLCLVQKSKSDMQKLCKCHHQYCYSCLNSYTIMKIQELIAVKCPQQQCSQTMIMTSNVYRFLPDSVKLKYLNNKHTFNVKKDQYQNKCQRCLDVKHTGQCKYALVPQTLQQTFQHRQCPTCKVQIELTQGKKKVKCPKCQQYLCYLCGTEWKNGQKHICEQKQKIRTLQKQQGYHGCCYCECCSHGCQQNCVSCGNCCCRSCGECCLTDLCCQVLFSCENPGVGCCVWNICSIPVRLLITLLVILMFTMMLFAVLFGLVMWIILCFFAGFFYTTWEVICDSGCPLMILLLLFYPFVGFYCFVLCLMETSDTPGSLLSDASEGVCTMIGDIWLELSPSRCQC